MNEDIVKGLDNAINCLEQLKKIAQDWDLGYLKGDLEEFVRKEAERVGKKLVEVNNLLN